MRLTICCLTVLGLSTVLLSACSTPNKIRVHTEPENITNLLDDGSNKIRYANLYRGKQQYPVSCSENCYPAHPQVLCETPAQNCRYTGIQQPPQLNTGFAVQWLGHASFMVQTPDGQQILIDPVTGQFDWPVNWAAWLTGTSRQLPPAWDNIKLADTDAVLYSHLHYDHFSHSTIEQIGNQVPYYMPIGMANYMPEDGYQVIENGWYSSNTLGDTVLTLIPAHHFNSRYLVDDFNRAMWGGWLVQHGEYKLLFAGDTGYSPHFKDIQHKYGDIDICLLPIASYFHETDGDWYRHVHTTPEDALTAAQDLGCKLMIPWGYGNASWQMGDHSSHSPLLRLLHMQQQLDSQVPLLILNEGDSATM